MRVSVVIPTYNRADVLRKTLTGYSQQSALNHIHEVLVIDDGSSDRTHNVVLDCARNLVLPLKYLYQANSGLAAARNHAIRVAAGDLILLGDDDIIPDRAMVAQHVTWHEQYPEPSTAVLGYVDWAPEVCPTPFMKWSGLWGPQFSFGCFKPGMQLEFQYGYFCNTSVKTSFLRENGFFSEVFREYGWEDLEYSYRLCQNGYRLLYNPSAIGYHYKFETFDKTRQRVEKLYQSWPVFAKTDAGKTLYELWRKKIPNSRSEKTLRRTLKPFKKIAMPILKPLIDTRIPLPGWLYDMMFYYYVTPLSAFIAAANQAAPGVTR